MSSVPRILIVDDDTIITHLISRMLQKKGYNIVGTVSSGEEAVLKSADLNPDLVIMDIGLSGQMDGIAAARYIFQLFQFPIIFITGTDDEKLLEHARCSQPYGIIFKPFRDIELISNVELALYNHSIRKRSLDNYPLGEPGKIMGVNEVIIVMDPKGRIIFFNPYTAWYIDLPAHEILMSYWRDVLMLINDQSGEQLKDPITEVVQQNGVVMYDSNTAVVTKSGKRRKAGILVQPLKDDCGKMLAVSMKIKEKKG
jgi:two-component system, response regulator PdtaR